MCRGRNERNQNKGLAGILLNAIFVVFNPGGIAAANPAYFELEPGVSD